MIHWEWLLVAAQLGAMAGMCFYAITLSRREGWK